MDKKNKSLYKIQGGRSGRKESATEARTGEKRTDSATEARTGRKRTDPSMEARAGGKRREQSPFTAEAPAASQPLRGSSPGSAEECMQVEGRNAVIEALRSGRPADRLYILDGCRDGAVGTIRREAAKAGIPVKYVSRDRLDQMSATGVHQGVIAVMAACHYAQVEELLQAAQERGEDPFLILLDGIEDPHNLGAILRTANVAGVHGIIIPRDRAVGLTAAVARASAGAVNYTPVAKVTNLSRTIEELQQQGLWFVCADMGGVPMTQLDLRGPIGLVIGNEGDGVSRLVREKCDMIAAIPQRGQIDSLNASVAAGILAYEILRQRGIY